MAAMGTLMGTSFQKRLLLLVICSFYVVYNSLYQVTTFEFNRQYQCDHGNPSTCIHDEQRCYNIASSGKVVVDHYDLLVNGTTVSKNQSPLLDLLLHSNASKSSSIIFPTTLNLHTWNRRGAASNSTISNQSN